jgi:hypothetical protein
MKNVNPQKIILGTMSLLACLTLSAQGGSPRFSSANGRHGSSSVPRNFLHVLPSVLDDAQYLWDDGSAEDSVGFGNGEENFEALWFNQFNVVAGAESIASLEIAWGDPANPTPASQLNGLPVQLAIWSDPNNDGDPSDAFLLGSISGVIQDANTDTFVTYTFPTPVNIGGAGTSFFVGDMTPAFSPEELFMQALDNTQTHVHSWVAAMSDGSPVDFFDIGNNDFRGTIDSFGLPGNWLIRANGVEGAGGVVFLGAVSRQTHGPAGRFNIALPGIEPRTGDASIFFRFNGTIESVDSVTASCGSVMETAVAGGEVNVKLEKSDCDVQTVTITLNGVHDTEGNVLASATTSVSFLIGDATADGIVNGSDLAEIRAQLHQPVTSSNFRDDIVPNGKINTTDARIARQNFGHSLP